MKWASALSRRASLVDALADAVEQLGRGLDQIEPDVAFVFLHASHAPSAAAVAPALAPWLGAGLLVGVAAPGVYGAGLEVEDEPAVAMLAGVLPEVEIEARHVAGPLLDVPAADAAAWRALLGTGFAAPSFVVLAHAATLDVERLLRGLDAAHPGAPKIGGLYGASRAQPACALLLGDDVHTEGAITLAFGGNLRLEPVIAQGCRPVGEPHFVTACHEHLLRELDGRSPREVLARLYESLPDADRALFTGALHVGLAAPGERHELAPGDFLVRDVLGLDPDTGALWLGATLERNSILQFHVRDARAASADLALRLARLRDSGAAAGAAGALLFGCVGRGSALYGAPGHDTRAFQAAFGELPLAGSSAHGEIGPIGASTCVHGYTAAFGLFRPR